MARRGRPRGSRSRQRFDPASLVAPVDVTPKIDIKTKRLSLAEAKAFHKYLGQLISRLKGKKK